MAELESPLAPVYRLGSFGDFADGVGVTLGELQPGSIVQVSAWPTTSDGALAAIGAVSRLTLTTAPGAGAASNDIRGFGIGPNRWLLLAEAEGLADRLRSSIAAEIGSVTDLSHGRTVLRVEGPKAEWVLAKLFAIDFSPRAFPLEAGRATVHHDITAQIQRTGPDRFDLVVFRSFARAFWRTLGHAAEEVGYAVR
jgi:heterotetrameric sarcosine oxidase gamma subunit